MRWFGFFTRLPVARRYEIVMLGDHEEWQEAIVEAVCKRLFEICADVQAAYDLFDLNHDGEIESEEFARTLEELDIGLTADQIESFMASIDQNQDGSIQFDEFAQRFEVIFVRMKQELVEQSPSATLSTVDADTDQSGPSNPTDHHRRRSSILRLDYEDLETAQQADNTVADGRASAASLISDSLDPTERAAQLWAKQTMKRLGVAFIHSGKDMRHVRALVASCGCGPNGMQPPHKLQTSAESVLTVEA